MAVRNTAIPFTTRARVSAAGLLTTWTSRKNSIDGRGYLRAFEIRWPRAISMRRTRLPAGWSGFLSAPEGVSRERLFDQVAPSTRHGGRATTIRNRAKGEHPRRHRERRSTSFGAVRAGQPFGSPWPDDRPFELGNPEAFLVDRQVIGRITTEHHLTNNRELRQGPPDRVDRDSRGQPDRISVDTGADARKGQAHDTICSCDFE